MFAGWHESHNSTTYNSIVVNMCSVFMFHLLTNSTSIPPGQLRGHGVPAIGILSLYTADKNFTNLVQYLEHNNSLNSHFTTQLKVSVISHEIFSNIVVYAEEHSYI